MKENQITFKVGSALKDKLETIAQTYNISVSELVRIFSLYGCMLLDGSMEEVTFNNMHMYLLYGK